ncbi:MAG: SDR family oxidoreductase [Rhizobiaceae bacterium]|nr:SDR family oxidoreductase [Rhizobiaceae bacterium]
MSAGELQGKVVLITGAARGQGAAEARLFHAEGAAVLLGDIRDEVGEALARELGGASRYVRLDVTSEDDWTRAIATAEAMGGLHGLLNNAGVYRPGTIAETDAALWQQHVGVNQFGCYLGMRAAAPAIERSGGGAIVNISSVAGQRGSDNAFAYCATKWALRGMSRAAARELAPRGIRVNCIFPGIIDTEMLDPWTEADHRTRVAAVPMKRKGSANEIAEVALFLLSQRSSYMTGAEIAVDGGLSA